jgi:hypothetical protein
MTLLILRPPWRTTEEVLWWKTPVMETRKRKEANISKTGMPVASTSQDYCKTHKV